MSEETIESLRDEVSRLRSALVDVVNLGTDSACTPSVSTEFLEKVPAECAALKQERNELSSEVDRLKGLLQGAKSDLDSAQAEIDWLRKQHSKAEEIREETRTQIKEPMQKLLKGFSDMAKVADLDQAKGEIKSLEEEISSLRFTIQSALAMKPGHNVKHALEDAAKPRDEQMGIKLMREAFEAERSAKVSEERRLHFEKLLNEQIAKTKEAREELYAEREAHNQTLKACAETVESITGVVEWISDLDLENPVSSGATDAHTTLSEAADNLRKVTAKE